MAGTKSADKQVVTERLTVGMIPKALGDLDELQTLTGLSKTDVINRAVSLYAFVAQQLAEGNELLVRDGDSREVERVHLL